MINCLGDLCGTTIVGHYEQKRMERLTQQETK